MVYSAISFLRIKDRDISFDAKQHREGEWTVLSLKVPGAIASFAAIILFSHTSQQKAHQGFHLGFVIATLALSWLTTKLAFAYRYADEYCSYDPGWRPSIAASNSRRMTSRIIWISSIFRSCWA